MNAKPTDGLENSANRFTHENRPLAEWLLQLVEPDAPRRKAAAKVITDRFYMPLELMPDSSEAMDGFLEEFAVGVRRIVNGPGFPAATFVNRLIELELALYKSWCEANHERSRQDAEFDKQALAKLGQDPTEGAKKRYVRRMAVRLARECKSLKEEQHEILTTGAALVRVIESLGKELLPAAEQLRQMLEVRGKANLAVEAIGRMGRDGLVFYDELVARLHREDFNHHAPRALGSLLQSAPEKVPEILALTSASEMGLRINAITALGYSGRKATASFPEVEVQLRAQLARCADDGEWHALVMALAEIAQTVETVDLLLGFLAQADKQGPVILALGQIGKAPEKVLPRLTELLDSFEEADPDWCYHGEHERVVQALSGFGAASQTAVPALIWHIWTRPRQSWDQSRQPVIGPELDEAVIRFLGELGPLAKAALPALLEARAEETKRQAETTPAEPASEGADRSANEETFLDIAIRKIQLASPS